MTTVIWLAQPESRLSSRKPAQSHHTFSSPVRFAPPLNAAPIQQHNQFEKGKSGLQEYLLTYSGKVHTVCGSINVTVTYQKQECHLNLQVVEFDGPTLMGYEIG